MTIVRKHKRRTNKGLTRVKQHNRKVRVLNRFGVVKFPTKKEKIAIEQFKRDMETKKVRKKKRQAGYYYGGKDKEQMKALAEFLDQMLDDKHGRKVRKKNISRLSTLSKKELIEGLLDIEGGDREEFQKRDKYQLINRLRDEQINRMKKDQDKNFEKIGTSKMAGEAFTKEFKDKINKIRMELGVK